MNITLTGGQGSRGGGAGEKKNNTLCQMV